MSSITISSFATALVCLGGFDEVPVKAVTTWMISSTLLEVFIELSFKKWETLYDLGPE